MTSKSNRNQQLADERTPLLTQIDNNDGQETQLSGVVNKQAASLSRQIAPDLLRGLLMTLMAIDHTSVTMGGYAHGQGILGENASQVITEWNTNLAYTLRTLSHFCAPGFTFLLGMGVAYFVESRVVQGMKPLQFAKHFALRSLAIILVNLVAFSSLLFGQPHFIIMNVVLWALAIDYLIVGALCILLVFVVEPLLSEAFKRVLIARNSGDQRVVEKRAFYAAYNVVNLFLLAASVVALWSSIWTSPNQGECRTSLSPTGWAEQGPDCSFNRHFFFNLWFRTVSCPNLHIFSGFPPMAWLPFALFGLLYGRILIHAKPKFALATTSYNALLSVVFALLFVSTRLLNYGNLTTHCLATPDQARQHESHPNQYLASVKSFFYVSKYPPSPAFAFFTLSGCFLFLAIFSASTQLPSFISDRVRSRYNPLLVYGNQSLFFYGGHLIFLQLIKNPIINSRLAHPLPEWSKFGRGIGLGGAFLAIYCGVLLVMYAACYYYSNFKRSSGRESIWRFL
ncbi:hypothetical protein CBS101457_002335 [Exobasidium rhododendri]|nr:hypothetical protein CBS101457_002335 [Exobasidium rhododendri]